MEKLICRVRSVLFDVFSDAGLYALMMLVHMTFSGSSLTKTYEEISYLVMRFLLIPWGAALCMLRLRHAQRRQLLFWETAVLALLVVWVTVPFMIRFGIDYSSISSGFNHSVMFFGIYAALMEEESARRAQIIDRLCALGAVIAFVLGGALLYTAVTVQTFFTQYGEYGFGIVYSSLCAGVNRNATAMSAVALTMLCLAGVARRRHPMAKAAHAIPAVMIMLVVVLTQSRTSRLALLLGLAACVYGVICTRLKGKVLLRHGAGIACGLTVLVLGYIGADAITHVAVAHYNDVMAQAVAAADSEDGAAALAETADELNGLNLLIASAAAEEAQPVQTPAPTPKKSVAKVRPGFDATLSERTLLWENLFALWRENPKYMIIGNGLGRTGSLIIEGTMHEKIGYAVVHNAYLQFIADYGLIGFGLLVVFFVLITRPVLRAFYASGDAHEPGIHVFGGLIVAVLATGVVESLPLEALSPACTMLFVALAILTASGRRTAR